MYRPKFIPSATALPATADEFLDALKVRKGVTSDYELQIAMGWRQNSMSAWRTHRQLMTARFGVRIADELGLPRPYVLACLEAAREKDKTIAGVWLEIAKRYRPDPRKVAAA